MPDALLADAPRIRSRTFAALAESPAYRRFYLGQGVSLIGTWLQDAAVSWIVFDMTRSEWVLGLVSAAGTMPGVLFGLIAGGLADRVAPRSMILGMQVGQMLLAFVLAILVGLGVVQIWEMALVLALARVCVTFEMPSRQVFLYALVGRSALMNAIALNSGLFNASRVLGPALAGLCLARLGRTACFTLNGVSYLAAIAALLTIRLPRPENPENSGRSTHFLTDLRAGLDYLRGARRVRTLYALMAFLGVVGMGYSALVPAYARLVIHTGAVGYSVLLSCGGLGATIGALVVASMGGLRRKEDLILGGMALFSVALLGAGIVPGLLARSGLKGLVLPAGALGLLGTGFGGIIFFAATQTLIQTIVPDALRGRIMGIWMIVFSGTVPLGSIWAGWVARWAGIEWVMIASAVLCLLAAWAAWNSGLLDERAVARPDHPIDDGGDAIG
jgi:MFS family permease